MLFVCTMSTVDSLLLPIMNNNNNSSSIHANSRFQDFNYHHHHHHHQQHQFLLSPSTSNSIIKNGISAYTNNNNSSTLSSIVPGEEISTIFVVGFPENMQEREFQNMFIFSPGFEAATLKLPPTSLNSKQDFEDDSNRKQIVSATDTADESINWHFCLFCRLGLLNFELDKRHLMPKRFWMVKRSIAIKFWRRKWQKKTCTPKEVFYMNQAPALQNHSTKHFILFPLMNFHHPHHPLIVI